MGLPVRPGIRTQRWKPSGRRDLDLQNLAGEELVVSEVGARRSKRVCFGAGLVAQPGAGEQKDELGNIVSISFERYLS